MEHRVFHKYRGDSEFTEKIITSGQVFLATAHQLNDPFECSMKDIASDWLDAQIKEGMQGGLTGFLSQARAGLVDGGPFFGATKAQIEKIVEDIQSADELADKYDLYRHFLFDHTGHWPSDVRQLFYKIDEQLVGTGIFSMSANPAQPLLWAHYGQEHNGLCLGFAATPVSKLADPNHLLPVIYSDELPEMGAGGLQVSSAFAFDDKGRPYVSSLKVAFEDKTYQRVVSTKSTDWAYEEEWRYIEPYSGLCDWPGELRECTFGLRCPEARRLHYIDLLENHVPNDVALFEIRGVPGTNALQRVPMDPPVARSKVVPQAEPEGVPARELTPQDFAAWMTQLMQQERYGEVIFQTEQNLERDPGSAMLLHFKASAHGMAGDHEKALEIHEGLHARYPDVPAPLYGMAVALEQLGRMSEVVPLLRRAYALGPEDPSVVFNLGVHLVGAAETLDEGVALLKKADRLGHRRASQLLNRLRKSDAGQEPGD